VIPPNGHFLLEDKLPPAKTVPLVHILRNNLTQQHEALYLQIALFVKLENILFLFHMNASPVLSIPFLWQTLLLVQVVNEDILQRPNKQLSV
jgi:hypothetical protein